MTTALGPLEKRLKAPEKSRPEALVVDLRSVGEDLDDDDRIPRRVALVRSEVNNSE